jgi:ubiquinone/menaquinone biosynthesis C-methylase UbiE
MNHVIKHVADHISTLGEYQRVPKKSGKLVAVALNVESWGYYSFDRAWVALGPRYASIPSLAAAGVDMC